TTRRNFPPEPSRPCVYRNVPLEEVRSPSRQRPHAPRGNTGTEEISVPRILGRAGLGQKPCNALSGSDLWDDGGKGRTRASNAGIQSNFTAANLEPPFLRRK